MLFGFLLKLAMFGGFSIVARISFLNCTKIPTDFIILDNFKENDNKNQEFIL